jgi:hypothetical protein
MLQRTRPPLTIVCNPDLISSPVFPLQRPPHFSCHALETGVPESLDSLSMAPLCAGCTSFDYLDNRIKCIDSLTGGPFLGKQRVNPMGIVLSRM